MNRSDINEMAEELRTISIQKGQKCAELIQKSFGPLGDVIPMAEEVKIVTEEELTEILKDPAVRPHRFITHKVTVDVTELLCDVAKQEQVRERVLFASDELTTQMNRTIGLGGMKVWAGPIQACGSVEGFTFEFFFHVLAAYARIPEKDLSTPVKLTKKQQRELDDVNFDELKDDYLQVVKDSLADGVLDTESFEEWLKGTAHGIVTCKDDTTIPCTAEHEDAVAEYLAMRFREGSGS